MPHKNGSLWRTVCGAGSQRAALRLVSTNPAPRHVAGVSVRGYPNRHWTTGNPRPGSRILLEQDSVQYRLRFAPIRSRCAPSGRKTRLAKMGGRYDLVSGSLLGRKRPSATAAAGWDRDKALAAGVHG